MAKHLTTDNLPVLFNAVKDYVDASEKPYIGMRGRIDLLTVTDETGPLRYRNGKFTEEEIAAMDDSEVYVAIVPDEDGYFEIDMSDWVNFNNTMSAPKNAPRPQFEVTYLNLPNATEMIDMFTDNQGLMRFEARGGDFSKVKTLTNWFVGCYYLTLVDLTGADFRSVNDLTGAFAWIGEKLEAADLILDGVAFPSATIVTRMFQGSKLRYLPLETLTYSKLNCSLAYFSTDCLDTRPLDLTGFNFDGVTSVYQWLFGTHYSSIKYWGACPLTTLYGMFLGTNAKSYDISYSDFSKATSAKSLFHSCGNSENVNIQYANFANATDFSFFISSNKSLKSISFKGVNMPKVKNVYNMFANDGNLEYIDFDEVDLSGVTNCDFFLYWCTKLKKIRCTKATKEWMIAKDVLSQRFGGPAVEWIIVEEEGNASEAEVINIIEDIFDEADNQ